MSDDKCIFCNGRGIISAYNPPNTPPQLMVIGSHNCDNCGGTGKEKGSKFEKIVAELNNRVESPKPKCCHCQAELTADEIKYYEVTCENCEGKTSYEADDCSHEFKNDKCVNCGFEIIKNNAKEGKIPDNQCEAEFNIGKWLSAALDDPEVCAEMKLDIVNWFTYLDTRPRHH